MCIYTRAYKSKYMCVFAQMCESPSLSRPTLHSVFLQGEMRNYVSIFVYSSIVVMFSLSTDT